MANLVKSFTEI